jgi:hypothetical protein
VSRATLAVTAGACAICGAFVYLHFSGNGIAFFVLLPVAFALGWTAVVLAARRRQRLGLILGAALVAVSAALIAQLVVFVLTCRGIVDWGSC